MYKDFDSLIEYVDASGYRWNLFQLFEANLDRKITVEEKAFIKLRYYDSMFNNDNHNVNNSNQNNI